MTGKIPYRPDVDSTIDRVSEQDPTLKSEESVAQQNSTPSWIQKVEEQSARDARVQPWLALMSDELNGPENDGKDLIRVERSIGGSVDSDSPFRTQNTSLAA